MNSNAADLEVIPQIADQETRSTHANAVSIVRLCASTRPCLIRYRPDQQQHGRQRVERRVDVNDRMGGEKQRQLDFSFVAPVGSQVARRLSRPGIRAACLCSRLHWLSLVASNMPRILPALSMTIAILMAFQAQEQLHALGDALDVIKIGPAEEPALRDRPCKRSAYSRSASSVSVSGSHVMLTQVTSFKVGSALQDLDVRVQPHALAGAGREEVASPPTRGRAYRRSEMACRCVRSVRTP